MSYYHKYVKYKTKYLILKGGDNHEKDIYPSFGIKNPQIMNKPYWVYMVNNSDRYGWIGRGIERERYGMEPSPGGLHWRFNRLGQTLTILKDNTKVYIGGEYEDKDFMTFYIYNDVVTIDKYNNIMIYGYPLCVFKPTDFHTATLVDRYIYIIGGFGYPQYRDPSITPVYKLNLENFSINEIKTTGNNPKWIYSHRAKLQDNTIIITGGYEVDLVWGKKRNIHTYKFNIETNNWEKIKSRMYI